jgi:hypothetical protein
LRSPPKIVDGTYEMRGAGGLDAAPRLIDDFLPDILGFPALHDEGRGCPAKALEDGTQQIRDS